MAYNYFDYTSTNCGQLSPVSLFLFVVVAFPIIIFSSDYGL